jgi:hypothetical protein
MNENEHTYINAEGRINELIGENETLRKQLEDAKQVLYIIKSANLSGYFDEHDMILHLQLMARNIYNDITKER